MKKFSQNFIVYHGCGSCYYDGTNRIVAKNRRCINPTYNPFWKKTNDVRNEVETRAQLKLKSIVTQSRELSPVNTIHLRIKIIRN